eukprot:12431679-Heterocapsa_arctica.AAC.1
MVIVPGDGGAAQDCSSHEGFALVESAACWLCSDHMWVRVMGISGRHGRGPSAGGVVAASLSLCS